MKVLKVSEILDKDFIIDIKSDDKEGALKELIEVICKSDKIDDCKSFSKAIFAREKLMSTGIGYGIAIPHVRLKSVKDFVIALGRKPEGVKYESIDDKPVQLIFMIGASDSQDKEYIKLLSRLVLRLKNKKFVEQLLSARDSQEVYELIERTK
jgi:fructose-specific phosphotransferase system IIA component